MKPSGDLVILLVEFAASMKTGHNKLEGRNTFSRMDIHRNTPAIILYSHNILPLQRYYDIFTEACQGFVYRIIDNFIY